MPVPGGLDRTRPLTRGLAAMDSVRQSSPRSAQRFVREGVPPRQAADAAAQGQPGDAGAADRPGGYGKAMLPRGGGRLAGGDARSAHTTRVRGSTVTERIPERPTTAAQGRARPSGPCPPPRTATGTARAEVQRSTPAPSSPSARRATSAGRSSVPRAPVRRPGMRRGDTDSSGPSSEGPYQRADVRARGVCPRRGPWRRRRAWPSSRGRRAGSGRRHSRGPWSA